MTNRQQFWVAGVNGLHDQPKHDSPEAAVRAAPGEERPGVRFVCVYTEGEKGRPVLHGEYAFQSGESGGLWPLARMLEESSVKHLQGGEESFNDLRLARREGDGQGLWLIYRVRGPDAAAVKRALLRTFAGYPKTMGRYVATGLLEGQPVKLYRNGRVVKA